MARKTIFVSDLTGKTMDEKEAATLTIRYADARRGQVVLDVNANEVADLAAKGTKQARRGRKPKNQSRLTRRARFSRTFLGSAAGGVSRIVPRRDYHGSMGLTLLAGPANAGKVALLLERYLADLAASPF